MAAPQQSPMRRRNRLGSELRQLREEAGLTGDQVIERIGWASASKLSRLENGRSRPELHDVLTLLDLYQVFGARRDMLATIVRDSGDMRKWLRTFSKMTDRQLWYAELEAGCAEIREYSPVVVPGLLQTDQYAELRFTSSLPLTKRFPPTKRGVADPAAEVQARMSRQSLLTRDDEPPLYSAVLEEAALSSRAGPPAVLHRQLDKLCRLTELENVTIQVILREALVTGWYLPHTAFSLYQFPDPKDPEAGSIEGLDSNLAIYDESELKRYKMVFEWLQEAALSVEDTRKWLTDAAGRRSGGSHRSNSGPNPKPPSQRSPRTGRLTEQ